MHHEETERIHDRHLTFYLLLSGFQNNQNSCFNFLTSCPMYLFVPPPANPTALQSDAPFGHLGQRTWNNHKKEKLQEDSPNGLMIIKQKKLHINWILYFCCCSKQPVHVL